MFEVTNVLSTIENAGAQVAQVSDVCTHTVTTDDFHDVNGKNLAPGKYAVARYEVYIPIKDA